MDSEKEMHNLENQKKKDIHILMVGLDDAGKTALLYKLIRGKDTETIPSLGYNVETVEFENMSFTFWDIGGLKTVRCLWNHFTENKSAVIFVVDSSNPERFEEAKQHLHTVMTKDDLLNTVLLVVANKQDKLQESSNVVDLEKSLDLKILKQSWSICSACAVGSWSLDEVLQNLSEIVKTLD